MIGVIKKTQRRVARKVDQELLVKALNSKAISWVSFDLCENRRGENTRICATSLVFQSLADWPTPSAWGSYASKLTHSHTLRFTQPTLLPNRFARALPCHSHPAPRRAVAV